MRRATNLSLSTPRGVPRGRSGYDAAAGVGTAAFPPAAVVSDLREKSGGGGGGGGDSGQNEDAGQKNKGHQLCRSLVGKDIELDVVCRQFESYLTAGCV